MSAVRILDVTDVAALRLVPPCADSRFDHRSCDYWEDADRGSKAARASWLPPDDRPAQVRPAGRTGNRFLDDLRAAGSDNPFAPPGPAPTANPFDPGPRASAFNPFAPTGEADPLAGNPFAPPPRVRPTVPADAPRKLQLLGRGLGVFGSYAKVLLADDQPAGYCQFGPLTAYPRAQRLRDLYPQLPVSPLPAVITCIATTAATRGQGWALRLVDAVCEDLSARGFSAIEAYPEPGRPEDETSAASPAFWLRAGFVVAVDDERFPVVRRELG
jgi:ribosomal protein S18 acetylase RimI-like enzyme